MRVKIIVEKGGEEGNKANGSFILDALKASGFNNVQLLKESKSTAEIELDAENFAQVVETVRDLPNELVKGWKRAETV